MINIFFGKYLRVIRAALHTHTHSCRFLLRQVVTGRRHYLINTYVLMYMFYSDYKYLIFIKCVYEL